MDISPRDFSVINGLLNGRSRKQLADDHGLSPERIGQILKNRAVMDAIAERLEKLGEKVITFKLDAVDGAIDALAEVKKIAAGGKTEEIRRLASMDVIKISGLMPRKRILVEGNTFNGIDDDLKDYIQEVMKESQNIISVEPG